MSTSTSTTLDVFLDANICMFDDTYLVRGAQGGKEIAQILLAWLALQFPEVRSFSLYLIGDFDRLFVKMDQSWVNIHPGTFLEFTHGFAQAVSGNIEFRTSQNTDKASVFSELMQQSAAAHDDQQILLGALSQDVKLILEEEKREGSTERIALLETVERLAPTPEADEFRKTSNNRIFRDRLYCVGM